MTLFIAFTIANFLDLGLIPALFFATMFRSWPMWLRIFLAFICANALNVLPGLRYSSTLDLQVLSIITASALQVGLFFWVVEFARRKYEAPEPEQTEAAPPLPPTKMSDASCRERYFYTVKQEHQAVRVRGQYVYIAVAAFILFVASIFNGRDFGTPESVWFLNGILLSAGIASTLRFFHCKRREAELSQELLRIDPERL